MRAGSLHERDVSCGAPNQQPIARVACAAFAAPGPDAAERVHAMPALQLRQGFGGVLDDEVDDLGQGGASSTRFLSGRLRFRRNDGENGTVKPGRHRGTSSGCLTYVRLRLTVIDNFSGFALRYTRRPHEAEGIPVMTFDRKLNRLLESLGGEGPA